MKKLFGILLLVTLIVFQGGFAFAGETSFSGLAVEPSSDAGTSVTTNVVRVEDTTGNNTITVDGAGDVDYIETGGSNTDLDFRVRGYASFNNVLVVPIYLVANLPSPGHHGAVAAVTDASSATDCTVGGSTNINLCITNSTGTWVDVT